MDVSATLNADTSWPELVDGFVQFLRGTGFFINSEWMEDYIGHNKLSENAQTFIREYESHRDAAGKGEVEYSPLVIGGDTINGPDIRTKAKKKKAKK
jgi:hypothetical protein